MIGELQSWLTLVATVSGIYIAFNGLWSWKRELTGKRDIELCQKVIEMFYEAEHRINELRFPIVHAGEGTDRPPENGESVEQRNRRNTLFAPLSRLNKQWDFWLAFHGRQFTMKALFGPRAVTPFEQIIRALNSFRAAAATRYQTLQDGDDDSQGMSETRLELQRTLFGMGRDDDEISKQVKDAIAEMEAICIPIVRSKSSRAFADH